ncbi:uncharacterized protein RSE6_12775 [Rhynchosporium secalis]|uniref:Uncharacterized protein n=1 Tax=Rhynchosporium secalis TaxID=38038 RepID=A0A1E1MR93_RHYSE|nr:uncharacterized protein RSE6_12775 [Rhynchosporium secalis]
MPTITLYYFLILKRPSDTSASDIKIYLYYDTTKDTRLPIYVRLDDSYLVAYLLDFTLNNLNDNFPTDFILDIYPRGAYKDYSYNRVFVLNKRLAIIFITIGNLSLPYICGNITRKARDNLLLILDEPVEIERPLLILTTRYYDKRKEIVPRAISERILSNYLTRGYLPNRPDFKLIAYAIISLNIEGLLNRVVNWNIAIGSQLLKDFLNSFEKLDIAFRTKLANNFSALKVYDINNSSILNKRASNNSIDASLLKHYKGIYSRGNYYNTTSLLIVKEEKEDKEDLGVIKPSNNTKSS